jgi:hypothetical protein
MFRITKIETVVHRTSKTGSRQQRTTSWEVLLTPFRFLKLVWDWWH